MWCTQFGWGLWETGPGQVVRLFGAVSGPDAPSTGVSCLLVVRRGDRRLERWQVTHVRSSRFCKHR